MHTNLFCFTIVSIYHLNITLSKYFVVACSLCTAGGSRTYKKTYLHNNFSLCNGSIHPFSFAILHSGVLLPRVFGACQDTQMPQIIPQSLTSTWLLGFFIFSHKKIRSQSRHWRASTHLFAVLPLQVQVISGIHASVHALFISGDSALHPDTLGCRSQRKLLQVVHVNGRLADRRRGGRSHLLSGRQKQPGEKAVDLTDVRCWLSLGQSNEPEDQIAHWD